MKNFIIVSIIFLFLAVGAAFAADTHVYQFNSSDGSAVSKEVSWSYDHHIVQVNGSNVDVDISIKGTDGFVNKATLTNATSVMSYTRIDAIKFSASSAFNATVFSWSD